MLPILAGGAWWGAVLYLAAAIDGRANPAGQHSRWDSLGWGALCLAIAIGMSMFIAAWLLRPAMLSRKERERLAKNGFDGTRPRAGESPSPEPTRVASTKAARWSDRLTSL